MAAKKLLNDNQIDYNILCVLTNDLAGEPDKVWNFILREGIGYIQFIPCLEGLGDTPGVPAAESEHTGGVSGGTGNGQGPGKAGVRGLRPPRFAQFYCRIFALWLKELEQGHYVSVKFFDDTANYFFKGVASSCGIDGRCGVQFVVEADGGVYPCDFYVLDSRRTGDLTSQSLAEIFDSPRARAFLAEGREEGGAPRPCAGCPYYARCRGGCKRMRNVMCHGGEGSFCGYRVFLDKNLKRLGETLDRYF
jgi:uncharacterized protein